MTGPQQNVHTLFRHQTARKADAWRTSQGRPGAMVVDAAIDDLHIPKRRFLQALPHEMADIGGNAGVLQNRDREGW